MYLFVCQFYWLYATLENDMVKQFLVLFHLLSVFWSLNGPAFVLPIIIIFMVWRLFVRTKFFGYYATKLLKAPWSIGIFEDMLWNFPDDHHPAPTFTPPELPKRVHVRGLTTGNEFQANLTFLLYANFVQITTDLSFKLFPSLLANHHHVTEFLIQLCLHIFICQIYYI